MIFRFRFLFCLNFLLFFIIMTFSIRLKKRQRFSEIKKLNIFDFNKKIDDFERFLDIYMITTIFDFTNSNFIIILTSIDIFNFSKLKKAIFEQFARFWKILKFFRKNKNKNINIIRVWNNREKYIKTKNLKHFLKFDEINEQFEINRIKIRKFRKKIDKRFVVHNNRKIKRKKKSKKNFRMIKISTFFQKSIMMKKLIFSRFVRKAKNWFLNISIFLSFMNTKIQMFSITFDIISEKINT